MASNISILQKFRSEYKPKLPEALKKGAVVKILEGEPTSATGNAEDIKKLFPKNFGKPMLQFFANERKTSGKPVNVGVILSGGQAPGGHNVIAGLLDGIKSINKESRLLGFKGGPGGLVDNKYVEITMKMVDEYRNTGGFDMIGSGRTKLEKTEQFDKAAENCKPLGISTIVIIGGDDSNTNACLLAESYCMKNIPIQVIGCPKTIDGDLKNEYIEASFGFDTACKVYSELVGNIERDVNSAKKYWHFIRLMGRSASHITLECALQTHPNITLVGEEVSQKNQTLADIVEYMVSIICKRAEMGKNHGVVLVPEGLIEFIPEIKSLIQELNDVMAGEEQALNRMLTDSDKLHSIRSKLSSKTAAVYSSLPEQIQLQLIKDRDPHGNVQVSMIETEKLLIEMIQKRLKKLKDEGTYNGKFVAQNHFFGYEGRCAQPSNFDADYCYSLGYTAAALIAGCRTGYMASVRNLAKSSDKWICGGVPLTMMMNIERRHGMDKPVIQKALVKLEAAPFKEFESHREKWAVENDYVFPGPIQYFGPSELCDQKTKTLMLEHKKK